MAFYHPFPGGPGSPERIPPSCQCRDYKHHHLLFLVFCRKLAFDGRWPFTTPFREALGPLKGFPLLSLRTLKADTIAGLEEGQGEAVGKVDKDWQVNGKFGVVQFAAPLE